jgi:hypothetical protein
MKVSQAAALCLEYHKSNSSSALKLWDKMPSNEKLQGLEVIND